MPDLFDANGLQVKSLTELQTGLVTSLQGIYGEDINVDSNSPDGQMVGIVAQEGIDTRELLLNINAGFDPDQAEGVTLDQRCALIGIRRGVGTFTTVQITIVTTQALSLVGLDSQAGIINPQVTNLYTIKDDAGNQWYLLASQSPSVAGTYSYTFQSAAIGAVQVTANTITTPVTVIAGVASVNNPLGALNQGIDEETDSNLRLRFHASTTVKSTGYPDALEAALKNITGVKTAIVNENIFDTVDGNGTPAHSVWCIVDGGASPAIAQVIFQKRSLGCNIRGTVTYPITRTNGQIFTAKWDIPVVVPIYVEFALALPGGSISASAIAEDIVAAIQWAVGGAAVGSTITAFLMSLNPLYRVSGMGLSTDDINFYETLPSTSPANVFVMDVARFNIT